MPKKDKRVDEYIRKSAAFAQPILTYYRDLIHKVCPDVEEKIKWSFPHFDYNGGPMTHMASFKQHCAIGFWKAALMSHAKSLVSMAKSEAAMGHLGKITSLKDLPKEKDLIAYIKEAMRLNDQGTKLSPKIKSSGKNELEIPDYFMKAVSKNKSALKTFEAFSYSNKKEYVNWVKEAKTEVTIQKRLAEAVLWMSEGKIRNWKYLKN